MEFAISRNPSDDYRHALLQQALKNLGREEDLPSIIHATSPPPDITTIAEANKYKHIKVGIIGAGLAGLSSAYELRKLGCDITVFEGNANRIGGRVLTYYFTQNHYGELGAMRIPVSHETTWHYINLFKLNAFPFITETENNILYVDKVRIKGLNKEAEIMKYIYPHYDLYDWERKTPLSKLIEYVFNYVLVNLNRHERDSILTIQENYPEKLKFFDSLNFYQACRMLGLSEGGMNLINSTLGIDRGLLYNSYLELLREMYPAYSSYLYRIENGTINLPLAFYQELKESVTFRIGYRVKGIYYNNFNHKITLKYRFKNTDHFTDYDYIICAIPFSELRVIDISPYFSTKKMQAIRQVNYEPAQKTISFCNERFWERTVNQQRIIGGSSLTDMAITSIYYPSNDATDSSGVLIATYNIGLDADRIGNMNDNDRLEIIKRQLQLVHGLPVNYLDKVIIDHKTINWGRVDYALGAFSWYAPGQTQLFSYISYLPEYNNKVFFAGEHISPFHAWMQGALQSGMVAANNLAFVLNKTRYK